MGVDVLAIQQFHLVQNTLSQHSELLPYLVQGIIDRNQSGLCLQSFLMQFDVLSYTHFTHRLMVSHAVLDVRLVVLVAVWAGDLGFLDHVILDGVPELIKDGTREILLIVIDGGRGE